MLHEVGHTRVLRDWERTCNTFTSFLEDAATCQNAPLEIHSCKANNTPYSAGHPTTATSKQGELNIQSARLYDPYDYSTFHVIFQYPTITYTPYDYNSFHVIFHYPNITPTLPHWGYNYVERILGMASPTSSAHRRE